MPDGSVCTPDNILRTRMEGILKTCGFGGSQPPDRCLSDSFPTIMPLHHRCPLSGPLPAGSVQIWACLPKALSRGDTHGILRRQDKAVPEEAVDEEPRAGALLFCAGVGGGCCDAGLEHAAVFTTRGGDNLAHFLVACPQCVAGHEPKVLIRWNQDVLVTVKLLPTWVCSGPAAMHLFFHSLPCLGIGSFPFTPFNANNTERYMNSSSSLEYLTDNGPILGQRNTLDLIM